MESVSKADGKVFESQRSTGMVGVTEYQCSPMELNELIQVRQDALLLESVSKVAGKVVERNGSVGMAKGTERSMALSRSDRTPRCRNLSLRLVARLLRD